MLQSVHHAAIIARDYDRSRAFYRDVLGFEVVAENYREARRSWKCDLRHGTVQIELFSFPDPPPRPSRPEAAGLRHLAFAVADVQAAARILS
ncbi:VOC family protein, partial [Jatrophihabitans endophyticus]|uniref:VOC family protein n=1 Tax=Jatrophihabitans endophyticus TaxID=1206085 RepID=UPI0019EBBB7A|nr:VOC family protein [Jatrophihabitans endophyticus]